MSPGLHAAAADRPASHARTGEDSDEEKGDEEKGICRFR